MNGFPQDLSQAGGVRCRSCRGVDELDTCHEDRSGEGVTETPLTIPGQIQSGAVWVQSWGGPGGDYGDPLETTV